MHDKPVVLLDPYGHYAGLLEWVRGLRDLSFVRDEALDRLIVTTTVEAALDACAP
jgi:predicted Rossmann-fold nucleotide-binding protein